MIAIPNTNTQLNNAKRAQKDEFYTQYADIEKECKYYINQFKDKVVYCNTDNPTESNFWKYFYDNFHRLGLKKLVSTYYSTTDPVYKTIYDGTNTTQELLQGNGDFRSTECENILKEVDIVITNPPFSLFREYLAQVVKWNKQFLIIGSINAVTYKDVFPLIKYNKLWLGVTVRSGAMLFFVPSTYPLIAKQSGIDALGRHWVRVSGVRWFTNLTYINKCNRLTLVENYDPVKYPKYDNYDAINVDKVKHIPKDYYDEMGVPITFIDKYDPNQFEIIGSRKGNDDKDLVYTINGKSIKPYCRILIKRK